MKTENIIQKIKDISTYKNNWDNYGASPILKKTIAKTINYVESLDILENYCKFVVPTTSGGILIEYAFGNKSLELRFLEKENTYTIKENKEIIKKDDFLFSNNLQKIVVEFFNFKEIK